MDATEKLNAASHGPPQAVIRPFLLTIIVPFYADEGTIYMEAQALNGLRRWQEEFGDMILAAPLRHGSPPKGWVPLPMDDPEIGRVAFVYLPVSRGLRQSIALIPEVRRILGRCIDDADTMCFSIGGLFDDWGAQGALVAARKGRSYAVWTDRVESAVARSAADDVRGMRSVRKRVAARLMGALERRVISHATLGLFHGADTFEAYAPLIENAYVVHNIHLRKSDHIQTQAIEAKIARPQGRVLKIVYAGRIDSMKGPLDWVRTLAALHARGVPFEAIWYGDGSVAEAMQEEVAKAGLGDVVTLPGETSDRDRIARELLAADMLLFCHKTPESPRILIEALARGTPMIGYDSAYARGLVSEHGGGRLVPVGDTTGLANVVSQIAEDPSALPALIRNAYRSGEGYTDEAVFRHRSDLIRDHLSAEPHREGVET